RRKSSRRGVRPGHADLLPGARALTTRARGYRDVFTPFLEGGLHGRAPARTPALALLFVDVTAGGAARMCPFQHRREYIPVGSRAHIPVRERAGRGTCDPRRETLAWRSAAPKIAAGKPLLRSGSNGSRRVLRARAWRGT